MINGGSLKKAFREQGEGHLLCSPCFPVEVYVYFELRTRKVLMMRHELYYSNLTAVKVPSTCVFGTARDDIDWNKGDRPSWDDKVMSNHVENQALKCIVALYLG